MHETLCMHETPKRTWAPPTLPPAPEYFRPSCPALTGGPSLRCPGRVHNQSRAMNPTSTAAATKATATEATRSAPRIREPPFWPCPCGSCTAAGANCAGANCEELADASVPVGWTPSAAAAEVVLAKGVAPFNCGTRREATAGATRGGSGARDLRFEGWFRVGNVSVGHPDGGCGFSGRVCTAVLGRHQDFWGYHL